MNGLAGLESVNDGANVDVIVVGAGIAGIYCAHQLNKLNLSFKVLEAGDGVGGTWYWNQYPGARSDIESVEYSYQFCNKLQQEWKWPERYTSQLDMLEYLNHVTDRFNLRKHIQLNTRVISTEYDEYTGQWIIEIEDGSIITSRFCIMATGAVSSPYTPEFEGLDSFTGDIYHTARWPHSTVDFSNKRVGIIGTGTSGIQSIPIIAQQAKQLTVYQRTANYYVPIQNRPMDKVLEKEIKADYIAFRDQNNKTPGGYQASVFGNGSAVDYSPEEREKAFEKGWELGGFYFQAVFNDLLRNPQSNKYAADFLRRKIRSIVKNPDVAEKLCPDIVFGCKRLSMGSNYYEAFNRDNVDLIDIRQTPIDKVTPNGLLLGNEEHALDAIVFATGFYDMVDSLRRIKVYGKDGCLLSDKWANKNPTMYLGMAMADFPNMFVVTGPGSPSITTNMVASIEQNVNWIVDCISYVFDHNFKAIEATQEAQKNWADRVNQLASTTLYHCCNSRYVGPKGENGARYFMPYLGYGDYLKLCEDVVAQDYIGFCLTPNNSGGKKAVIEKTEALA